MQRCDVQTVLRVSIDVAADAEKYEVRIPNQISMSTIIMQGEEFSHYVRESEFSDE